MALVGTASPAGYEHRRPLPQERVAAGRPLPQVNHVPPKSCAGEYPYAREAASGRGGVCHAGAGELEHREGH